MTYICKYYGLILNIGKCIKFTKIDASTTAHTALRINYRNFNADRLDCRFFRAQKQISIGLFHITININRLLGNYCQIDCNQSLSRTTLATQHSNFHLIRPRGPHEIPHEFFQSKAAFLFQRLQYCLRQPPPGFYKCRFHWVA